MVAVTDVMLDATYFHDVNNNARIDVLTVLHDFSDILIGDTDICSVLR